MKIFGVNFKVTEVGEGANGVYAKTTFYFDISRKERNEIIKSIRNSGKTYQLFKDGVVVCF